MDGRDVMEKRLKDLIQAAVKTVKIRVDEEDIQKAEVEDAALE